MVTCWVCHGSTAPFRDVDSFSFHACGDCGLIQLDQATLDRIDSGEAMFKYQEGYWASEMFAARERAFGIAIARAAEVFFCSRRPIERFLDVGTGPGAFLDAVAAYLPHIADRFHAVELYPPPPPERTAQPNYRIGRVGDYVPESFDGGLCIEVFEHLTPQMVDHLLGDISTVSREEACFLVNTGLTEFVRNECPDYLDPVGRGHITIWTVDAVDRLARRHGLTASPIPGRTWCFLLEKAPGPRPSMEARIAAVLPENRAALARPVERASPVGVLAEVGLLQAYFYDQFLQRTQSAMALEAELIALRRAVAAAEPPAEAAAPPASRARRIQAILRRLARALRNRISPP